MDGNSALLVPGMWLPLLVFGLLLLIGLGGRRMMSLGPVPLGRHHATHIIGGALVGGAAVLATCGVLAAYGAVSVSAHATTLLPLIVGTLIILLQSSAEEVFFRGWIQTVVSRYWGKWPGIVATSLLYAAAHTINGPIGWVAFANIFLAGIFLGKLYRFSGGILAPAAAHFGWNWTETILLGASPNPGVGRYGSMFDLDLKGAAAMFGGSEQGINASIAVGIILLLLIALMILSRRSRGILRRETGDAKAPTAGGAAPQALAAAPSAPRSGLRVQDDAVTNVGKIREINEDSMQASRELGVWTVADGMGGHEFGERASKAIVDAINALEPVDDFQARVDQVRDAILAANTEIYAEAQQRGQRMGSTVVSLVLKDDDFAVMWAGDSRAYLFRDGKLTQVSRDHTQVQSLIDRGLLAPEDAAGHPMSHVLARAIGVMSQVDVDIVRDKVKPGDIFLLCSDGLYGLVSDDEIAERLVPSRLGEAASGLIDLSLERGAPDNVTVIAVAASEVTLLSFGKDRTDGM